MKKLFSILLIISLYMIVGCTKQQLSREEQLAIQQRNMIAAVKNYSGFTKDQLANSIEKVLYLMDTSDANIVHYENSVVNFRKYLIYMVLSAGFGYDTWVVNINKQDDNSFDVSIAIGHVQNFGMFPTMPQPKTPAEIKFPANALDEAESKLFFERLDYFLGLNNSWRSCKNIKEWAKENNYQGAFINSFDLPYICGHNWFGIEDQDPSYLEKK